MSNNKMSSHKNNYTCARMDSCIGDPNLELSEALKENNLRLFVDILCMDNLEVNKELKEFEFSTILHLAVDSKKVEFVRELLKHKDVSPNLPHRIKKMFPIHMAAEAGNYKILDLLLSAGADVNAKMENGSTALHILALRSACRWAPEEADKESLKQEFVRCVQLLLSKPGVNLDYANNIGATPLFFAAEKGTEGVAKALLDKGASITTEVDGQPVEELLEDKMPKVLENRNLERNRKSLDTIENQLFHVLYLESTEPGKFVRKYREVEKNNNQKVNPDADNGTYTFLQYACDQGLDQVVAFLLQMGADPNLYASNYKMPPLLIAGHHGYYKIIRLFKQQSRTSGMKKVDFGSVDGIKQENVLHKILKEESRAYINFDFRNYDQCISLLLDTDPVMQRMIQAAIDGSDQLGNTPLHVAAECGRDNAIRKLLRCGANIGIRNQRDITPIDKIPPSIMEEFLDECLLSDGTPVDDEFKLTFRYVFLGPPLRREWKREQLLKEMEGEDGEKPHEEASDKTAVTALPEAEPLWYLSQSPSHRALLTHPVISSFLCLKWRRMRPYYYLNLGFYLTFVVFLTSFLLLSNDSEADSEQNSSISATRWITLVLLVGLTIRELFQSMVSFRRYIFNLENLLEVSMIVMIYLILFANPSEIVYRYLSGASLLLCWIEMVLLFGRHPKLSTYITMFSTVSMNFLMFLTWYISFIIAFGLAFFIVLKHPTENAYFISPSKALLKTVVMSLTGEIEFEGIEFGGLFAVFLFLLYVFFIMLVLVNLLNGLAVSDIAEIQKHAEVVSHASRVELIAYMESMLLGDPFNFLTNWPPVKWLRRLPSCSCLNVFYTMRPVRKIFDTLVGNTQLFQSRLKEKMAVFVPNQSRFESSLPGPQTDNLVLDGSILKRATNLIIQKQGEDQESRLAQVEKTLKLLADQNNHIIELLQKRK